MIYVEKFLRPDGKERWRAVELDLHLEAVGDTREEAVNLLRAKAARGGTTPPPTCLIHNDGDHSGAD